MASMLNARLPTVIQRAMWTPGFTLSHHHRGSTGTIRGMRLLIGSAVTAIWRTFRADARAMPRGTWRRWSITLLVGWIVCAALSAGLTKAAQRADGKWLRDWDERML